MGSDIGSGGDITVPYFGGGANRDPIGTGEDMNALICGGVVPSYIIGILNMNVVRIECGSY